MTQVVLLGSITLFQFADRDTDISEWLDAYHHKGQWVNRLILGDSLNVMNSLLEYEGLGGQVQMIYIDPPAALSMSANKTKRARRSADWCPISP